MRLFRLIAFYKHLKVPEFIPRDIPGKGNNDGNIAFSYHSSNPGTDLDQGMLEITPVEGMMYIWPARLFHTVWPFQGKGERRSIAFNAIHHCNY